MDPVYVVTQEGVNVQGVFGPFTYEEARAFAAAEANHPYEDGYHQYAVRELTPDGLQAAKSEDDLFQRVDVVYRDWDHYNESDAVRRRLYASK